MKMSNRISSFQASPIRRLSPYARSAVKRGITVYHLNIGQPDIKTPQVVLEAIRSYNEPIIAYGSSEGYERLRNALPAYYATYGVDIKPEDILITTGGSEALLFTLMTLCDPGDQVIIPEPFYTNVSSFAHSAMVELVPVTSRLEDAFALPPMKDLEKLINPKTKAILLCSPNNPTGHVYSKEDLERTLQLCKKHDIFLVVDEVYREFCYDGERFTSILTFEEYADRVVCVDSFSKRYSMCGARVGMLVSRNKQFLTDTLKLSQARLCPPDIEQVAAAAALTTDPSYLVEVKKEYESRRNFLIKALKKVEGVKTTKPKGAFYIIAELPVEDAEDFATFLLRDFDLNGETVMLAPAEDFYATKGIGRRQVRIAYVLNKEDLGKAVACLAAGLKAYAERGA